VEGTRLTLLGRAGEGQSDAWAELDRLYRPFVMTWFGSQGLREIAEDLTQDVMLALAQELPKFQHAQRTGAFRNWLRTVCLHRLLNHRRARSSREGAVGGTSFLEQMHEAAAPDDAAAAHWDREHTQAVLQFLFAKLSTEFDSKTIAAFRQVTIDECLAADVATELGMSAGAVYVAKSRVLRRLREMAADLVDDEMLHQFA
jgi:RNA polymerase sigma-70 factor, ECF subfamily